jgi:hypothetical protein
LAECSLGDLGFKGSKFTWANKRDPSNFIKERLDQALATDGWCEVSLRWWWRFYLQGAQTISPLM